MLWINKDPEWKTAMRFLWFNPGIIFKSVADKKVRSIILASGTLKPFDILEEQLQTKFPIKLENGHIILKSQLLFSVVSRGVDNIQLNMEYSNRNNIKMIKDCGQRVLQIISEVKGGVLVFFPSYDLKTKLIDCWKNTKAYIRNSKELSEVTIYEQIDTLK